MNIKLRDKALEKFAQYLREEEKSELTIGKYLRDVKALYSFCEGKEYDRRTILQYKAHLVRQYKPSSVNSMIAAINCFFGFKNRPDIKLKPVKMQKSLFASPEKMLTKDEYERLLDSAKETGNERLNLIMQTICATGIRISELKYVTVKSVTRGRGRVVGKCKSRTIFFVPKLRKLLLLYAKGKGITEGSIFLSRRGAPLSRHQIWSEMKCLCGYAEVDPVKVFPHNLRHLFARCFYSMEKDLGRLADILGHSNINTTRIYTMECGKEHVRILSKLSLVHC